MTKHTEPASKDTAGPETSPPAPPIVERIGRAHLDPDVRTVAELGPIPRGLSAVDYARMRPAKSFTRSWVQTRLGSQKEFAVQPETLLAQGAAVGLDGAGLCQHIRPGVPLKFLGFVLDMTRSGKVVVKTSGLVELRVAGLSRGDAGKKVYASDINSFSLDLAGGHLIGTVHVVQPDAVERGQVSFHSHDLPPLDAEPIIAQRRR